MLKWIILIKKLKEKLPNQYEGNKNVTEKGIVGLKNSNQNTL